MLCAHKDYQAKHAMSQHTQLQYSHQRPSNGTVEQHCSRWRGSRQQEVSTNSVLIQCERTTTYFMVFYLKHKLYWHYKGLHGACYNTHTGSVRDTLITW